MTNVVTHARRHDLAWHLGTIRSTSLTSLLNNHAGQVVHNAQAMHFEAHTWQGTRVIRASVLQTLAPMFGVSNVVVDERIPSLANGFQAWFDIRFLSLKKAMLQEQ